MIQHHTLWGPSASDGVTARESDDASQKAFPTDLLLWAEDDPFMWSVHAWNATLDRWVREGKPVSNLDSRKETNMLFLMVPPDVPYENMVHFCNEVRKLSAYPETRRLVGERI